MKKAVKISLIVIGSIFGLLLAAVLLVSPIAKWYIEKHDKELIGRELTIGKLWVNLVSGTVKIEDLTLYEDDETTPFVSFDHFDTRIKVWDLLDNRLWVKHALLSGLKVSIEQNRTWFNFDTIVEHFASDEPKEKSESSNFGLIFNDITIEKSYLRYTDLDIGSEFNLRDIAIHVPFVDLSDMKTNVGLDLCLADSATLHTDLHLSQNAEEYFVNLKVNDLGIDIIEPYLQQTLAVDSLQGLLSLDLSAEGRTEHILDFDMKGDIFINDLSLCDNLGYKLGHVDSIYTNIGYFNLNQNKLTLNNLHLSGLETAYIVNADSTTNFDLFLGHVHHRDTTVFEKVIDTVAAAIEEVQERKTLSVDINELRLDRINLVYQDYTLPNPFTYEVSDIRISSENFTLFGNNAVRLEALLNKVGRLNMQWQGDINGLDNHDLTLMLSNVKVSDFSPYVQQMFGYPLENGTLSFRSQNKIVDGNLQGINKLQLASPAVGDKMRQVNPEYPKIPLKLGLYLLTDKNHNVSIDLPISGNLNDPQFSYRKALLKVFGNLLVKVVTSPFRLFSDDDDIQYIPFDLLQTDFSADEYTMIDNVVNAVSVQPDLSVVFEQRVNYNETLQRLCNMQLQRDFYLSQHPEIDSTGIDFLTNEAIQSIKLSDNNLCDYAVRFSEKEKLSSKKDVESIAYAVYHERSKPILSKLMDKRNALLSNYLLNVKGLSTQQISVTKMDEALLETYSKPTRYELYVQIQEELESD
jgi:hypothetical protein